MNIADAHNYLEVFWYQSFTNETAVEWIFFSAMIANSSLTLTLGKDVCRYGRKLYFCFYSIGGDQLQSIFVKLEENTFLGISKLTAWSSFTLAMPYFDIN